MSELAIRRGAAPALAIEGLTLRLPARRRAGPRRRLARARPGRVRPPRRPLRLRQVDPAASRLRPRPALPRRRDRGPRRASPASTRSPPAPASSPRRSATSPRTRRPRSSRPPSRPRSSCRWRCAATPPASRARAVEEVALALAIPHLLDRTVDTLSGGELQRVALAAALVTRPRLVLLDEPTSQLDPVAGDELIWLLRRLNEEWGVAVLLAEHRLERCLAAADRVIAMDSGAIAFDGSPRDFLAWAQRRRPGSGDPRRPPLLPRRDRPAPRRRPRRPHASSICGPGRMRRAHPHATCSSGARMASASGDRSSRSEGARLLDASDLWVELWIELSEERARRPAGHRPDGRPRRAGRPDGPQRRREEHAAADRRRPDRAGRGARSKLPRRDRPADPEPKRLPGARAGRGRAAGR